MPGVVAFSDKKIAVRSGSRGIKVLRLSHSAGVSTYRERERHLIQHPLDVMLLLPRKWKHIGGDGEAPQEEFAVKTVKTFGTGSIPLFAYDPFAVRDALLSFKPDIVDIHEEPYSVSCFEVMSMTRRILPGARTVFYSAQNIHKDYPFPFSWSEQYVYANSSGAYPCSSGVKEVLNAKGFAKQAPVIPLGINTSVFKRRNVDRSRYGIPQDCVVLGYVGRLEQSKGVQYVIEALGQIKDSFDYRFVVIGAGSFQARLREQAQELGIADRVLWLGERPMNEMPTCLSLCDVGVVPSVTTKTWREQFGRTAVEFMACGVPVIASDSGSLPEVVSTAGIIVPEQNAGEFAEAIALLISEPELREELQQRGLALVESKYTWKRVAQMMFDLYQNALANRVRV
jgi:glycosyltransferase involved in cell wall biosynthesis